MPNPMADRLDRGDARRTLPLDGQSRQDADREAAPTGSGPELPGVHAAVRPRPLRPRSSLPQPGPLDESPGPSPGEAAGADGGPSALRAHPRDDRRSEPLASGLGGIFPPRLPQRGIPRDELVRG